MTLAANQDASQSNLANPESFEKVLTKAVEQLTQTPVFNYSCTNQQVASE